MKQNASALFQTILFCYVYGDCFTWNYLVAAFLCEKVLHEQDGVLSFIRVVDRFTRPEPTPPAPPPKVEAILVVGFKAGSGIATGKYKIKLRLFKPSSMDPIFEMVTDAFFSGGDDQGAMIVTQFVLAADEEGLFWIDVLFVDQLVTRVPFRVIFASTPTITRQAPAQE